MSRRGRRSRCHEHRRCLAGVPPARSRRRCSTTARRRHLRPGRSSRASRSIAIRSGAPASTRCVSELPDRRAARRRGVVRRGGGALRRCASPAGCRVGALAKLDFLATPAGARAALFVGIAQIDRCWSESHLAADAPVLAASDLATLAPACRRTSSAAASGGALAWSFVDACLHDLAAVIAKRWRSRTSCRGSARRAARAAARRSVTWHVDRCGGGRVPERIGRRRAVRRGRRGCCCDESPSRCRRVVAGAHCGRGLPARACTPAALTQGPLVGSAVGRTWSQNRFMDPIEAAPPLCVAKSTAVSCDTQWRLPSSSRCCGARPGSTWPSIVDQHRGQAAEQKTWPPPEPGPGRIQPWTLEPSLDDVVLAGAAAGSPPQLQVKRIHANAPGRSPRQPRACPVIDNLDVDAPLLRLSRLADGGYDIDDMVQKIAAAPPADHPARFAVHNGSSMRARR